jgi:hypothetical protein
MHNECRRDGQTTAPGCLTPEPVTPTRLPLPEKTSSLVETAAWAT